MADPGKGSEGSQAPTPPISDLLVYKGLVIIHHGGGGGRSGLEDFGHVAIKDT